MKKILLSILILFVLFSSFSLKTFAQTQDKQTVILPSNEIVNNDYFTAGRNVIVSGTVNGDVYAAGSNVTVDGNINGDLLVAGGTVTINGKILHNVRAVGGTINVNSNIGGNLSLVASKATITDMATVSGSIVGAASDINILAPVEKDVTLLAGNALVGNSVGGSINATVSNLVLSPNAQVNGDVNYRSDQKAQVEKGSSVSGQIVQKYQPVPRPQDTGEKVGKGLAEFFSFLKFFSIVISFIVGFLILKLLPAYFMRSVDTILQRPGRNMLFGFIALVFLPIIGFIFLITLIGIPVSILLFIVYLVIIYLAKIFVAFILGQKVLKYLNINLPEGLVLLTGIVLYSLLTMLPLVGWLIWILTVFMGAGGIIVEEKRFYFLLRSKKLI